MSGMQAGEELQMNWKLLLCALFGHRPGLWTENIAEMSVGFMPEIIIINGRNDLMRCRLSRCPRCLSILSVVHGNVGVG